MAFKRRERSFSVCGEPVTHASHDAPTTSNIVFDVCCRFAVDAA